MSTDIRTKTFVLRRTNIGESDRILNLLTENGAVSVLAKGVRKEKSKLAGGIELFTLSEITYHENPNANLGILTSARMLEYYNQIPVHIEKLELASSLLKKVSKVAEFAEGPGYFDLVLESLRAINSGTDLALVETWFLFNFARIGGEDINLLRDTTGRALAPDMTYVWDAREQALRPQMGGFIGVNEIKLMRYMLASSLSSVAKLKDYKKLHPSTTFIAKSVNNL